MPTPDRHETVDLMRISKQRAGKPHELALEGTLRQALLRAEQARKEAVLDQIATRKKPLRTAFMIGLCGAAGVSLIAMMARAPSGPAAGKLPAANIARAVERTPRTEAIAPESAARPSFWSRDQVSEEDFSGHLDPALFTEKNGRFEQELEGGAKAILTLDVELQNYASRVLAAYHVPYGAAVVTSLDGRVLALAGYSEDEPTLTLNELTLRPWAPAASVFKLVTATALLSDGLSETERVCYHGGLRGITAEDLLDNPRRDRSCEALGYGVSHSQNVVVAKLAQKHLSSEDLSAWAVRLGFNRPIPFALQTQPSPVSIPSDALEFPRAAAGFYHSALTPLHGATFVNTIASGGHYVAPRLVAALVRPDGQAINASLGASEAVIPETAARQLARMMIGTTTEGTARSSFTGRRKVADLRVTVAGKTGSLNATELVGPRRRALQYSWFVGFAPADRPKYSISVLVGNDPNWTIKAHTAAALILARALNSDSESSPNSVASR